MISIDYISNELEGISRTKLKKMMLEEIEGTAKRWRKKYLPRHFGNAAMSRYGYKKRSKGYNHRKRKGKFDGKNIGHTRPLEKSGEAKLEALRVENITTGGTSKGVWAKVQLPRKYNLTSRYGVKMADEIRAVRADEVKELSDRFIKNIDKRLNALAKKKKRK